MKMQSWEQFSCKKKSVWSLLSSYNLDVCVCNRPAPPLPHFHLSEETANEASTFLRDHINTILSVSEDIALGRDTRLYVRVALVLLTISVIGSLTSFLVLGYISKWIDFKRCVVSGLQKKLFYVKMIDLFPRCRSCSASFTSSSLWKIWSPNRCICCNGVQKSAGAVCKIRPRIHLQDTQVDSGEEKVVLVAQFSPFLTPMFFGILSKTLLEMSLTWVHETEDWSRKRKLYSLCIVVSFHPENTWMRFASFK